MTDIVPAPDVALSSQFPTNADRVAGVFNAKAAAWADSSRAMAADMDAAAKSAATNAQAAEERAVAADQSAQDANQYKLDAQAARDSAQGAAVIVGRFDKLYLGPKAEFPSLDNEGGALQIGAEFFHTVLGARYSWSGTEWLIGTNVTAGVSQVGGKSGALSIADTSYPSATNAEMVAGVEVGKRSMSPAGVKAAIDAGAPVGTIYTGLEKPVGAWLETGKVYLQSSYPVLFAQLGLLPDGVWRPVRRTLPASLTWKSVTYGNGLFVAVASNTSIAATSPDGTTWTQRSLPLSLVWSSVTYGAGLFVAVAGNPGGNTASFVTSPDGINWTQRTMPVAAGWSSVTYGGGLFVAVSSNGNSTVAVTSPDGINWTQRTMPVAAGWSSVTYGNGLFVAVASNTSIAATSPDGITWTQRSLPITSTWTSVTYGNGLFVAVAGAFSNGIAATSLDGINWTLASLPALAGVLWKSVTYGNGLFVAVGSDTSPGAATSPDGINWTQRAILTAAGWSSVTYGGGLFVAVAENTNNTNVMTIPDRSYSIDTQFYVPVSFGAALAPGYKQWVKAA